MYIAGVSQPIHIISLIFILSDHKLKQSIFETFFCLRKVISFFPVLKQNYAIMWPAPGIWLAREPSKEQRVEQKLKARGFRSWYKIFCPFFFLQLPCFPLLLTEYLEHLKEHGTVLTFIYSHLGPIKTVNQNLH